MSILTQVSDKMQDILQTTATASLERRNACQHALLCCDVPSKKQTSVADTSDAMLNADGEPPHNNGYNLPVGTSTLQILIRLTPEQLATITGIDGKLS
ncbi:MAG: hypothetical protein OXM61_24370 [Candidatus Poribacteria bacterium]|nr:hypothetical protein [Candidatus Poribacteria bacterium]